MFEKDINLILIMELIMIMINRDGCYGNDHKSGDCFINDNNCSIIIMVVIMVMKIEWC